MFLTLDSKTLNLVLKKTTINLEKRRKMTQRQSLKKKEQSIDEVTKMTNQVKILWKNPWVKGVAVLVAIYGALFIAKYLIKEYAEVVAATKKLRDAHRL